MPSRHRLSLVGVIFISLVFTGVAQSEPPAPAEKQQQTVENQPGKDCFGDLLPSGASARMGSIRWRVDNAPASLRHTPDGKRLLVFSRCAQGATPTLMHILDNSDGKLLYRWENSYLNQMYHISPDGRLRAVYQPDSTGKNRIVVTELGTGRLIFERAIEQIEVQDIHFAPDSRCLATVERTKTTDRDENWYDQVQRMERQKRRATDREAKPVEAMSVNLWDVIAGKEIGKFACGDETAFWPSKVVFAPQGNVLALVGREVNPEMPRDKPAPGNPKPEPKIILGVRFWDFQQQRNWRIATTEDITRPFAFSPDGKQFATLGGGKVRLWDTATGKLSQTLGEVEKECHALIFSPDGKKLIVGERNMAQLWDTASGEKVMPFGDGVCLAVFSPDGQTVAVGYGDDGISLIEVSTGKEVWAFEGSFGWHSSQELNFMAAEHGGVGWGIDFSPDGTILAAAGSNGLIRRWSVETGQEILPPEGCDRSCPLLAVSPDGKVVATGFPGGVNLWEAATGKLMVQLPRPAIRNQPADKSGPTVQPSRPGAFTFSLDSKRLAAGWWDGAVTVWDLTTNKPLWGEQGEDRAVQNLTFTAEGGKLVSCDGYGIIWWDVASGRPLRMWTENISDANAAGWPSVLSHNLRAALTYNHTSKKTHLTELATGKQFREIHHAEGTLYFSPDDALLLSSHKVSLTLIDTSTGKELRHLHAPTSISCAAFSPDSVLVAAACQDGNIYIWETATATLLGHLTAHAGGVETVAFGPDGRQLISFGNDSSVLRWDIGSFRAQLTVPASTKQNDRPAANALTPDIKPQPTRKPLLPRPAEFDEPLPKGCYARLGSLRFQQEQWINGIRYLPDGKTLISNSGEYAGPRESSIAYWDAETGQRRYVSEQVFTHFSDGLIIQNGQLIDTGPGCACFSSDGTHLAQVLVTDLTMVIQVREVTSGKTLLDIKCPDKFDSMQFSPDGQVLAAASPRTDEIRLYAVSDGRQLCTLALSRKGSAASFQFGFSPDGKHIAVDRRGQVHILHTAGCVEPVHIADCYHSPNVFAFTPDSKAVAVVCPPCWGAADHLCLFDVTTGNLLHDLGEHDGASSALSFSSDGKLLASQRKHEISMWEVASGKKLPPAGLRSETCTFLIAPGSHALAVGDGATIRLIDAAAGKVLHELRPDQDAQFCNHSNSSRWGDQARLGFGQAIAFSPDGKTLAAAQGHTIRRWDVATGQEIDPPVNRTPVTALALSTDGSRVAAASAGHILLWGAADKPLQTLTIDTTPGRKSPNVSCVAMTADGQFVTAGFSREEVVLWNASGKKLWQQRTHQGEVKTVGFIDDGQTIISTGQDCQVSWRDVATGERRRQLMLKLKETLPPRAPTPVRNSLRTTPGLQGGRFLVIYDQGLELWDLQTARQRYLPLMEEGYPGWYLAAPVFSPDGRFLALAQSDCIRLYDIATGKELRIFADGRYPRSMAISPDGRLLAASGDAPQEVQIWETATGTILAKLKGHRGQVQSVAFSGDGRTLATGGWDSTVLLWDVEALVSRPAPASLTESDMANLWGQLASDDAAQAHAAADRLTCDPDKAVALLREQLQPIAVPDEDQLARLIADLDSPLFTTRRQAQEELIKLDHLAEPSLRQVLAGNPSDEVRGQAEELLDRMQRPTIRPEQARALRSIDLLERINTPHARSILESLARGAPTARETLEAKCAVVRLAGRQARLH